MSVNIYEIVIFCITKYKTYVVKKINKMTALLFVISVSIIHTIPYFPSYDHII